FGYASELGLGGKIHQVQVRYLVRWLQRDPQAALADFYQRAKLPIAPPRNIPYAMNDLLWGLNLLANEQTETRLPSGWNGLVGSNDPLLDSAKLLELEPRLTLVENAGHDPKRLLEAWASTR